MDDGFGKSFLLSQEMAKLVPQSVDQFDQSGFTRAMSILDEHSDKNFVQRILDPTNFPFIDRGNGDYSTHKMAWGESDGKFMVFPTIVHVGNRLVELSPDQAWKFATRSGEFIELPDAKTAEWFAQNYKLGYGAGQKGAR